jgi:hypothetical protein
LACHTAEIPFVFDHQDIIANIFSYVKSDVQSANLSANRKYSGTGNGNAITGWLTGLNFNLLGGGPRVNAKAKRRVIDNRVAWTMSEYWTTFATYRDPNGLPSLNGVAIGTRPGTGDGVAPWWPRLFGELPSEKAMLDLQSSQIERHRKQQQQRRGSDSASTDSSNSGTSDKAVDLYSKLAWDSSYRNIVEEDTEFMFDEDFHSDEPSNDSSDLPDYEMRGVPILQQISTAYDPYNPESFKWPASRATGGLHE